LLDTVLGPKVDQTFRREETVPLDPVAQQMLDDFVASGRPNAHLLPVDEARANFEALFEGLRPGEDVFATADHEIPVAGGTIRARSYRPTDGDGLGLVVYFHGGGWLLGSHESHDTICRSLANASGAVVLNVDYRKAPEHKFPTAVDDAWAALEWGVAHAAELHADPARVAVAGDSAGGNLAAVLAQMARDAGGPALRFQLLIYPVTTADIDTGFDMTYEAHFLYRDEILWHQEHYFRTPEDGRDPRVSPVLGDAAGLPPAQIQSAECDPLHVQAEQYRDHLRAAGVAVDYRSYDGMIHGYFGLESVFPVAADAMRAAGDALRAALA
jgi:acetyl esterase/lipase